jgi:hypothetical protein
VRCRENAFYEGELDSEAIHKDFLSIRRVCSLDDCSLRVSTWLRFSGFLRSQIRYAY